MKLGRHKPGRLIRRSEFLTMASSGRKYAMPGLLLQARPHDPVQHPADPAVSFRLGLTASKKVGGAVERNRARRRLRALAAELLPANAAVQHDYVVIARPQTVKRPYAQLRADLTKALQRLGLWRDGPQPIDRGPNDRGIL